MNYLTSAEVLDRYKISNMSLYRWSKDEDLNFPRPMIVKRRKFWREDELREWEVKQVKRA